MGGCGGQIALPVRLILCVAASEPEVTKQNTRFDPLTLDNQSKATVHENKEK